MSDEWKDKLNDLIMQYGPERIKAAAADIFGEGLNLEVKFEGMDAVKADLEAVTALAEAAGKALGAMGREVEIKINRAIPLDWFPVISPMQVQGTLNTIDDRRKKLREAQDAKEQAYRGYRKAEADVELARAEGAMTIPAEYNKNDQGRKAWEKKNASREIGILADKQDAKDCADSDYGFALDDMRAVEAKAELQAAVLKYLAGGVRS